MAQKNSSYQDLVEKIKENYVSALIGLVIFVLGIGFIANALSKNNGQTGQGGLFNLGNKEEQVTPAPEEKKSGEYTIKKGDTLWSIAEGVTGSGYNFVDIVKANNLKNANQIEVGQKLIIPEMKAMKLTRMEVKQKAPAVTAKSPSTAISGNTYTVVKGDTLWSIALRAYNNGYKWSEIAKANKLKNANRIEKGQKLTLPR